MQHVNPKLTEELIAAADGDERKRKFHVFHGGDEPLNRMLIAGVSGAYAAPHRHTTKFEVFTYVAGELFVLELNDDGSIKNAYNLARCPYVEVAPHTWHAVVCASPTWAFMEMALWPDRYDPADKEFAPWAPKEFDPDAQVYTDNLTRQARSWLAQHA